MATCLLLLMAMSGVRADTTSPLLPFSPSPPLSFPFSPSPLLRFIVVDPLTHQPLPGMWVTLEEIGGKREPLMVSTGLLTAVPTSAVDLVGWRALDSADVSAPVVALTPGETLILPAQTPPATNQQPPVRDIYIVVRASLLRRSAPTPSVEHTLPANRTGPAATGGVTQVIQHDAGVASDSAGQTHVRGEHAEIAYVVDGVPLPDTLSGRQGNFVVLSTIKSLDLLTGAYAPEYGGQTAAILDITTLPGARKPRADVELDGGSYDTTDGDFTWVGPISMYANYVFDLGATRTANAEEPQQPDVQTAHNTGASLNEFSKLRFTPSRRDVLTLTLSRAPDTLQVNNRTGLPASFAQAGEGIGFLGLRNADGMRPGVTADNAGLLGAQTIVLPSQQADHQAIDSGEVNEYGTFSWHRDLNRRDTSLFAVTFLHSGQDIYNFNPAINLLNLPVDNSIEYSPTVVRNVHHVQWVGSVTAPRGKHLFKTGFLLDDQNGNESYNLIPASQLALDDLAALAPNLAPAGAPKPQLNANGKPLLDAKGNPVYVMDVNGNPVYLPTSNVAPTLNVHRSGFYRAAYLQDTWQESRRFTINYGLRVDWYKQAQNLGQAPVDTADLSPRFNFSYTPDRLTAVRWSFNRLFNFPPLAQGAILGQPIKPETLSQYDLSVQRQVGAGQTVELAYYIKDIRNQVDTGLLIPGSWIGIYSAVNFQIGGIHGIEFSYDLSPPRGVGFDTFVNYTYSIAAPNGLDSTGAPAPQFNDHDQRNTVGAGAGYTWKGGANASLVVQYGSGLASSPIPPSTLRIPRTRVDLHLNTSNRFLGKHGTLSLDVQNLLDDRTVINFESGFSGTRFMQGRRILLSLSGNF